MLTQCHEHTGNWEMLAVTVVAEEPVDCACAVIAIHVRHRDRNSQVLPDPWGNLALEDGCFGRLKVDAQGRSNSHRNRRMIPQCT
jgi:hypothetical protein